MKNAQRKQMRSLRNAMTDSEVRQKSECIFSQFIEMTEYETADVIMLYLSAKNEPDTLKLADYSIRNGKKVVVPITNTDDNTLSLSYLNDMNSLSEGAFGISEPTEVIPCGYDEVELVVVPGLVFDKNGGRIGYGKGYYDRFFENTDTLKIAFCYDFQLVEKAEVEPHDVNMDIILTESRVVYCGK